MAIAVVATAVMTFQTPQRAHACSPPLCYPSAFVPGDEAKVPANLGRLIWRPAATSFGGEPPDLTDLRLIEDRDDGAIIDLEGEMTGPLYLLTPASDLQKGQRYRLVDDAACEAQSDDGPWESTFEVGEPAPLPETLGTISARAEGIGELTIATFGGQCGVRATADRVSIALEPAADAAPWLDVLHFETLVNDERWAPRRLSVSILDPGASWVGRGRDLLYRACETEYGEEPIAQLAAGTHTVRFRATLPGTDLELETPEVTVNLSCPRDEHPDAGAALPPGPDAGAAADPSSGGGCRAASAGPGSAYLVLMLAIVLAWRRGSLKSRRRGSTSAASCARLS